MNNETTLPISAQIISSHGRRFLEFTRTNNPDPEHELVVSLDVTHKRTYDELAPFVSALLKRREFSGMSMNTDALEDFMLKVLRAVLSE